MFTLQVASKLCSPSSITCSQKSQRKTVSKQMASILTKTLLLPFALSPPVLYLFAGHTLTILDKGTCGSKLQTPLCRWMELMDGRYSPWYLNEVDGRKGKKTEAGALIHIYIFSQEPQHKTKNQQSSGPNVSLHGSSRNGETVLHFSVYTPSARPLFNLMTITLENLPSGVVATATSSLCTQETLWKAKMTTGVGLHGDFEQGRTGIQCGCSYGSEERGYVREGESFGYMISEAETEWKQQVATNTWCRNRTKPT